MTKKIIKAYRLSPDVIEKLEKLTELYQLQLNESNNHLYSYLPNKKVTMTDVIETVIRKEFVFQGLDIKG